MLDTTCLIQLPALPAKEIVQPALLLPIVSAAIWVTTTMQPFLQTNASVAQPQIPSAWPAIAPTAFHAPMDTISTQDHAQAAPQV